MALTIVLAGAADAAAAPSPYRHALRQIDTRLRIGIEYAPVELSEALATSETVCRLAAKAEERGDAADAAADWSTLSQMVEELDRPAARRVDRALERADSALGALRERFSRGWSDPEKVRDLRRGVVRARTGVGKLRAAVAKIAEAFDQWQSHRCGEATDAIETGIGRIPGAVGWINAGMRILWRLAE